MKKEGIDKVLKPLDDLIDDVLSHVDLDEGGQCLVDTRKEIAKNLEDAKVIN